MNERLYKIISQVFNIRLEDIHEESGPENLEEWDSFKFLVLIDKIETLPKNQITALFDSILSIFSYEYWQFFTIFFQLLLVGFFILFFISKISSRKRKFFTYSIKR